MLDNLKKIHLITKKIQNFELTNNYIINNLSLLPYQNLFFLLLIKSKKIVNLRISSNLVNLRIRFYTSTKSNEFYEKVYFKKSGQFEINENFKRKIKYIFIFNPNSCTHEKIKFQIKSFDKIFLFNLVDKKFKFRKEKELFVIYSLGKTGSTSLINNLANVKANCIKIHRLDNSFKKFKKNEISQLNLSKGWPLIEIKSLEEIDKIFDLETNLNQMYFERYKKKFDKLIYLTVFREIISLYISSQFEIYGNFFTHKKSSNIFIFNKMKKNLYSYLDYCEKWLKNYFKIFNINIKSIKNDKFILKQTKKNIFYFCTTDEINELYTILLNKYSLEKKFFKNYNVSIKKEYAKKYNLFKLKFLNKYKNSSTIIKKNFQLIQRIEKYLKLN